MGKVVPEPIYDLALKLPYRDFITVGLLVKKLKLKNTTNIKTVGGIIPDCWIYIQDRDVKIGRLQIFNNWSPYMVKDLQNTVWIGLEYFCSENDAIWNMDKDTFITFAIDELVKINIIDKDDVLDAHQVKIKKAYPAYFGAYEHFDKVKKYLDSFGNLYCIGRNGQHKYNNMDHSMLTAIEAVKVLKNGGYDKSSIWNVNAEGEYHEEK
jgi:protoporphyrinogen oxidase